MPVSTNGESTSASTHIRQGRQELSGGRLELAEAQFRAALATDPNNAAAHLGLAEVDRRRYKFDDAIIELQASLKSRDSAVVRTTLAHVYMDQKKFALARSEAQKALALAPNYTEAKQLLDHLQTQKPTQPPPPSPRPAEIADASEARDAGPTGEGEKEEGRALTPPSFPGKGIGG